VGAGPVALRREALEPFARLEGANTQARSPRKQDPASQRYLGLNRRETQPMALTAADGFSSAFQLEGHERAFSQVDTAGSGQGKIIDDHDQIIGQYWPAGDSQAAEQ
jgi:hypothetical protein